MHKNAQKFEAKLVAKFPATTLSYSMVRITRLDAFLGIFKLEASPGEDQSLQQ